MNEIGENIGKMPKGKNILPLTDEVLIEVGGIIGGAFSEMMGEDHEKLYRKVHELRLASFRRSEIVEALVNFLNHLVALGKLEEDALVLSKMESLFKKVIVADEQERLQAKKENAEQIKRDVHEGIRNLTHSDIGGVLQQLDQINDNKDADGPGSAPIITITGRREMATLIDLEDDLEAEFDNEDEADSWDRTTELPPEGESGSRSVRASDIPTQQPSVPPEEFAKKIHEDFERRTNSGQSLRPPKAATFNIEIDDSTACDDRKSK